MATKRKRNRPLGERMPCCCDAYHFPHRVGGGECKFEDHGVYKGAEMGWKIEGSDADGYSMEGPEVGGWKWVYNKLLGWFRVQPGDNK